MGNSSALADSVAQDQLVGCLNLVSTPDILIGILTKIAEILKIKSI